MAIHAIAAGIIFSIGEGVSIVSTTQTQKSILRKDTVVRDRQRELSRNLDSGFISQQQAQAECSILGHEGFTYNEITRCFFCGKVLNV